jgi:death on curing protein
VNEPVWVLPEVVLAAHRILLAEHGGRPGILDHAFLDSALMRPKHRFAYDSNVSLFQLAAWYSFGLTKNHPFVAGNKRIALTIAAVFLELNGYTLDAPEAEAVLIYAQLAAGEIDEDALAHWFEDASLSSSV